MAAQTYIAISELHPNFSHPKVAGIIIGKTDVKSFPDRKNIGMDRFTFGFTVKDSPDFFINVTAWGNDEYINGLSSSFSIGDCVIIENPLVANKDPEKGDRFCPTTPSLYRLLVTEAHSQIGEPKQFTTSDRRKGQRLEVKLFDDSVSSFPLVCWDREAIQLVQTLIPKETVLFIADAKISFDSFRNGMTATVNSKTIITVNPDTREASVLFSYAKEASESGALDQDEKSEDETVDSITDVYTVSQLKKKAQENPETFFGITYSFISKLDLDSSVSKVIRTRCSRCKFQVTEDVHSCTNQFCPGRDEAFSATSGFDLLVDFTDHTGTLHSCTLRSPVAEKTLGCTTEEFTSLTDDQRTAMKWKFLLERCKIYIKILPSTKTKSGIRGVVLACSLADPGEVKQHMSALLHRL
uniref:meiosis-specific with OB domain-containing protein isoform X4 n=1 Tax=Scatophagus argus TaxID=75038 RepID=UPI001ED858A2|nr:meiosis-specific with OB domain-containing protein isoform X4 [Scatophagus argus]